MRWGNALRVLTILVSVPVAACVQSNAEECEDGRLCPAGTVCTVDGCAAPEQIDACRGLSDGDVCELDGEPVGLCDGGVCKAIRCGDGVKNGTEECDGADLGEVDDCTDLDWHDDEPVTCTATCTYDQSACTRNCGDGVVDTDAGETCDGADLGGVVDCTDLGFYDASPVTCNAFCRHDVSQCQQYCGNGVDDGEEECDGNTISCTALGFYDAIDAPCTSQCFFDRSACTRTCGDDVLDEDDGEECDGAPPPAGTCVDFGFDLGALGCTDFCSPAFDDCETLGWRRFSAYADTFWAIWGSGHDDVYGGGDYGLVHWDGNTWARVTGPTQTVWAIWGASADDVYAITSTETWHYDGTAWTMELAEGGYGVGGSGPDDVWVSGFGTRHWNGASWTTDAGVNGNSVWAIAPDDVYIDNNHWDGTTWSTIPGVDGHITSVWASGPTDVYISAFDGRLYHGSGSTWRQEPLLTTEHIWAVRGSGADDVYAVGDNGNVYHYDGSRWEVMFVLSSARYLFAAWSTGPDQAFVGGEYLFRYQGSSRILPHTSAPVGFNGVGGSGVNDVFAVGDAGTILHFDGVAWEHTPSPTAEELYAVWKNVAVGEQGTILAWNGTTWSRQTSGTTGALYGVWGSSATDVYAVGADGVFHFDGTTWSSVTVPATGDWYAVTGTSATDVWVTGYGNVLHLSGTTWTSTALAGTGYLYAVWAGGGEVWVGGGGGVIRRFNGSVWSTVASGTTANITAITGSSPTDLSFAIEGATYRHWNGSAMSTVTPIVDSTRTWRALWQIDATHMVAVGPSLGVARGTPTVWTDQIFPRYVAMQWASGPDDRYGIVDGSVLVHDDGVVVSRVAIGPAWSVWGSARDRVFVMASSTVKQWNGAAWITLPTLPQQGFLLAGTSTDVWVGSSNALHRLEAGSWVAHPLPGNAAPGALWAIAGDQVWAAGPGGVIYDWNGTSWTVSFTLPLSVSVTSLWASAANDVHATDGIGRVWHWDGTAWSSIVLTANHGIGGLTGTAADDVYIGSSGGLLWRYDGQAWSPIRTDTDLGFNGLVAAPREIEATFSDTSIRIYHASW